MYSLSEKIIYLINKMIDRQRYLLVDVFITITDVEGVKKILNLELMRQDRSIIGK